jgi:hypothetical protein
MIFAGIDDTDTLDSPGTNHVARGIAAEVASAYQCLRIVRHQLLFDSRIPYTSKNSCCSLWFEPHVPAARPRTGLIRRIVGCAETKISTRQRTPVFA